LMIIEYTKVSRSIILMGDDRIVCSINSICLCVRTINMIQLGSGYLYFHRLD